MVCGKGPSIGRKTKQSLKDLEDLSKNVVKNPMSVVNPSLAVQEELAKEVMAPDGGEDLPAITEAGLTEEDKEKLRKRLSFQRTRFSRGILNPTTLTRPSLLGDVV